MLLAASAGAGAGRGHALVYAHRRALSQRERAGIGAAQVLLAEVLLATST